MYEEVAVQNSQLDSSRRKQISLQFPLSTNMPNTDAGNFYEAESRKNVVLIHSLSSTYCVLSMHCLPFV